jgi:hypothetical protein
MRFKQVVTSLTLTLSFISSAFATPPLSKETKINWEKAEKNYIVALASDNDGLRHSAANFVGEYRLKGAVDHLIILLQTDTVEKNRMAAATALMQIGAKEAVKAVEDASVYDGSEKVARFCEQLINSLTTKDMSSKH